jgi:hypothetical protein
MAIETRGNREGKHPDTLNIPVRGEQQTTEQSGNIPPLHPIFERLSQTLAKQHAENPRDKPLSRKATDSRPQKEPPFSSQIDRIVQETFLEKFKRRRASQAEWMRNYRRRKKEAQMSEQPGTFPDTAATPSVPESPASERLRSPQGRRTPGS